MADTRLKRQRSDEQIVKKRDKDKERAKSRIYIGKTLEMWRELCRRASNPTFSCSVFAEQVNPFFFLN
ncbi:hypothetical protein PO909_001708 [Leuciscus waleckii]